MTRRKPRKPRKAFGCLLSGFLALLCCSPCLVRGPPGWWKAGHPRRRPGSLAEAELLSHLAVLLLPEEPIADLAVYGALQSEEAALYVEYDGYYRHLEPGGIAADSRKNTALLALAPAGSYVLRIAHAHRGLELSRGMGEVVVNSWQPGHDPSLVKALLQVAEFLLKGLGTALHPDRKTRLQNFVDDPGWSSRQAAVEFTEELAAQRDGDFDPTHLHEFLQMQLGVSISEAEALVSNCPALARCDIDHKLYPIMQLLEVSGLKKSQVAKVIARCPQVLGYSIEENLKPTVQWLRDSGLTKAQVAKVIARHPQVLGLSIEENLKRTVQWLRDLGLKKVEVAKVIARNPQVVGLSIEENLKPTVQWLRDLGLTKEGVAKVIAKFASVLWYSIEENLKPTVQWLRDSGLKKVEVAKVIARYPQVLGYSIEENLKPTVQWLRDLGLKKVEVAKVIARHPQVLGLSIEENLKPKVCLLLDWFSSEKVQHVLVQNPYILGRSRVRWVRRSQVLQACDKLSVFGSAMMLTDAAFAERYEDKMQDQLAQKWRAEWQALDFQLKAKNSIFCQESTPWFKEA